MIHVQPGVSFRRPNKDLMSCFRRSKRPRGMLCVPCIALVNRCDQNKGKLQKIFKATMKYLDEIDVFDDVEADANG